MAARARIGITGNGRRWAPSWWCAALAVWICGGRPVRISVRHDPGPEALSALIIGGGNDIHPEHYNGDLHTRVKADPDRDRLEIAWIRRAMEQQWPLLGICRGAQLINVVHGGNLHQDIRPMRVQTYNRPGLLPTKQVSLQPDSRIANICGRLRLRVNSLHHQAVRDAGADLKVSGRDLDQIIQAIESVNGTPIVGVQWHPEYLIYLPSQLALFRWLLHRVG